jgi:hypothetical protein
MLKTCFDYFSHLQVFFTLTLNAYKIINARLTYMVQRDYQKLCTFYSKTKTTIYVSLALVILYALSVSVKKPEDD